LQSAKHLHLEEEGKKNSRGIVKTLRVLTLEREGSALGPGRALPTERVEERTPV